MTHVEIDTFGTTVGGWLTYVIGTVFIVSVAVVLGWRAFRLCRGLIRAGWSPGYRIAVTVGLILYWLGSLVFAYMFIDMVVLEPVQSVIITPDCVVLKYRWHRHMIPWRDMTNAKLLDHTKGIFGDNAARSAWRKVLVISTRTGDWTIDPKARGHDAAIIAAFQAIQGHLTDGKT